MKRSYTLEFLPSSASYKVYKQSISRVRAIAQPIPAAFQANLQEMARGLEGYQSKHLSPPLSPEKDPETVARILAEKIDMTKDFLRIAAEQVNALSSKVLLYNWLFAILATAAEVYLEHALDELFSATLSVDHLPDQVLSDIKKTWIKSLLRNKPGGWITALRKMGADAFPDNLGNDMHALWEKRHQTVHSEQSLKANLEEFEEALKTVDIFIDTADAFIVRKLAEATQPNFTSAQSA